MKPFIALMLAILFAVVVYGCTQPVEPMSIQVDPYAAVQSWCDANPCACDDIGHKYLME